jgi:hypothetical protein
MGVRSAGLCWGLVKRLPSDEAPLRRGATAWGRVGAACSPLGFRGAARGVRHERWMGEQKEDWEAAVSVVMETTRERSERT